MIIHNILPYFRKDTSNLLVFSTAIVLLMFTSPLVLSHFLLQPVQAQTLMTFKTLSPAEGQLPCCPEQTPATMTFFAQGTASSSSYNQTVKITNGILHFESPPNNGQIINGTITSVTLTNDSRGPQFHFSTNVRGHGISVTSFCNTYEFNGIFVLVDSDSEVFNGPVECSSSSQGDTKSSSMSGTTPTQDSDGDGIPDSSDRCTHNSEHRCFKEGDTSTPTQQQQSSSTSMAGNQTG